MATPGVPGCTTSVGAPCSVVENSALAEDTNAASAANAASARHAIWPGPSPEAKPVARKLTLLGRGVISGEPSGAEPVLRTPPAFVGPYLYAGALRVVCAGPLS